MKIGTLTPSGGLDTRGLGIFRALFYFHFNAYIYKLLMNFVKLIECLLKLYYNCFAKNF